MTRKETSIQEHIQWEGYEARILSKDRKSSRPEKETGRGHHEGKRGVWVSILDTH